MAKFNEKLSTLISSQAPEFVVSEHPKFIQFLKTYYTFMESAELKVKSIQSTDGIILENETDQEDVLLLNGSRIQSDKTQLDRGDKIILESSSYGKFQKGETITGATSGTTATILAEDLSGNSRIFITQQDKFINDEVISGGTSGASATIVSYKPNPVKTIAELTSFKDPDKAISSFLTKFRNEVLATLPENLHSSVDKRKLIKNIKSLYRAKGTARGHELFFKLLFNESSQTIYPREQMLRSSDGDWDTRKIMRAIASTGDTFDLVGRTITGISSEATAVVETVNKFQIGADEVTEFILNEDSIDGTFTNGEVIRGTASDTTLIFIKATITGIVSGSTITNDGNLYSASDVVALSGGGSGASIQVNDVGHASISEIIVNAGGNGYAIGDVVNFTNSTGGTASAKVSVINGGFTPEVGTGVDLSEGHIVLETATMSGDNYEGDKFVQEHGTGTEDITDVRLINNGYGYTDLPTLSITSNSGSGAKLLAYGTDIGRVQSLKIVEHGKDFDDSPTPPTLTLPTNMIVTGITGTFTAGETVSAVGTDSSTITATLSSIDTDTQLMKLKSVSGTFATGVTITGGTSEATATIKKHDTATSTCSVASTADTTGKFLNQDGHISESTMKVQDSLYYQDFSYVIKVGRSINDWRKAFKDTMHTSGFYVTGRVNIESSADMQMKTPVEGIVSGVEDTPVLSVINTLFTTIFGRRLGTETDGTSQRTDANQGVAPFLGDSTGGDYFQSATRDVTLKRHMTIIAQSKARIDVRTVSDLLYGYALGQRMRSVNRYWYLMSGSAYPQTSSVGGDSTETKYISPMTITNWGEVRLTGTHNTSLDGEVITLGDIATEDLKTNIAFPTEIRVNYN